MPGSVSVIMPAHDAGAFIAAAIGSVLAQAGEVDLELLVVDDGSRDDTAAVVAALARRDGRVVPLANRRRPGPSGARNTGLLRARGEILAFLDADDLWLPDHLRQGTGFLERHEDIEAVFYNFEIRELPGGRPLGDWFAARGFGRRLPVSELEDGYRLLRGDLTGALLDESFVHLQSLLVRRRCLAGILFDERVRHAEDRDFCLRLHRLRGARFAYKNEVTGVYHRRAGSLSSDSLPATLATVTDHIRLFSGYLESFGRRGPLARKLRRLLRDRHLTACYCLRRSRRPRRALACLGRSLRYGITGRQLGELAKLALEPALVRRRGRGGRTP